MKKTLLCFLLTALMGAGTTLQAQSRADRDERRPETTEKQAKQRAKQLKLDDDVVDWFVPLYMEYTDTLRAVRAVMPRGQELEKLTDAEAIAAVEDMLSASEREVALKREYYTRFREKMTPQQALQLFMPQMPQRRSGQQRGGQGGPGGFPGGGFPGGGFPGGGF